MKVHHVLVDPDEETREGPLGPEEETREAPSDREDEAQGTPLDPEEETLEAPSDSEDETKYVAGLAEGYVLLSRSGTLDWRNTKIR